MTNFGMIEKGRLIEIEALYVSLGGLAIISWLSWWQTKRSRWLTWIVPWIFLGLGLLAKGPLHLLFFYAVVLAVLYRDGEWRAIWNPQHLLGISLMLGIFRRLGGSVFAGDATDGCRAYLVAAIFRKTNRRGLSP